MSWADRLLPAKLGGVEFLAQNARVQVGRRARSISIPLRDQPEHEDMGRRARQYSLTAIILGEDYDRARQRLVEVLEKKGPHVFSHPWWEERPVIVEDAGEFEESVERGGMVSISLVLTEAGEASKLKSKLAPVALLANALDVAEAAATADFESGYLVGIADSFSAAQVAIGEVVVKIDSVNNKIAAALGIADGALAALDELKDAVATAIATPAALAAALAGLVAAVCDLLGVTGGIEEDYPGQSTKIATETALAVAGELGAVDTTAQPPYPGGPVHPATKAATAAIGKAVRTMSLVGITRQFLTLTPESAEAAAEVLATLGSLTAQLLDDPVTSDDLSAALTDQRAALQQHIDEETGDLPTTTTYTPDGTMPAILIAWLVHRDPTRDREIVARNGLADPNFVTGGEPLEVLGA